MVLRGRWTQQDRDDQLNRLVDVEVPGGAQALSVTLTYERSGGAVIDLPGGRYEATEIDRTDAPGKVMKSWYAQGLLPVRVEQPQHDGKAIVLERN